jgi:hypothetical protein
MLIRIDGELTEGVTSKDIILHVIGIIGTAGGTGYTIEFAGTAVETLSMEARMSISNMAIEAGARAGIIAPDQTTYNYLKGRPMCPTGEEWDRAVEYWESLSSDDGAAYDETVLVDAQDIAPTVTWGTSPQDVAPITGNVPTIDEGVEAARAVRIIFCQLYFIWLFIFVFAWNFSCFSHTSCLLYCRLVSLVRWNTLVWNKDKNWRVSRSKRFSSVRAPTDVSRICVMSPLSPWAARLPTVYTP